MKEETLAEIHGHSDKNSGTARALFSGSTDLDTLLRRRAQQLAQRESETATGSEGHIPMMVFRLGEDRYALELSIAKQVLPFVSCTRVPGASEEILGVMNVYGDIRPVVDASRLLDLHPSGSASPGYVLFLEKKDCRLGLRVDAVEGITSISQIDSWKEKEKKAGQDKLMRYTKGMTADSIIVLDTEAILSGGGEER